MKIQFKKPTQKQLAIAFGVNERTIRNWNKSNPPIKLGRKPKIQINNSAILKLRFLDGRIKTQQEAVDFLYQERGIKVNQSTISQMLKKGDIARKKAAKRFIEQDLKKTKQFITDNYWLLSLNSFYALDECGFNLGNAPRYAYAYKERRAIISRPGKRGDNHTLILCIRNAKEQAVVSYKLIVPNKKLDKKSKKKKGTKAEDFHDFLASIDFPTDQENYLLLDNAKIHHAVKACQKSGRLPIKELAIKKILNSNT